MLSLPLEAAWPYYGAFLIPLLHVICHYAGWHFGVLLFVFGLVPLLDLVGGVDTSNPTDEQEERLSNKFSFKLVTLLWVPAQLGVLAWGAVEASQLSPWSTAWWSLALSMGVVSGMGINVAHELLHKLDFVERSLGRLLLVSVCYGHFDLEHRVGHHKRVATPEDAATAREGESFYAFYPRTVAGSFRSAVDLEWQRLQRLHLPWWRHAILHCVLASLAMLVAGGVLLGASSAAYLAVQAWFAFSLLEVVNGVEHAGMRRRKVPAPAGSGREGEMVYESVKPVHSWNSPHVVSGALLFKLTRHSSHHHQALRRYQVLLHHDEAPQLPTGYPGMMLLFLVPPLFNRVMGPRIRAHNARLARERVVR